MQGAKEQENELHEKIILVQKRGRITIPVEFRRQMGIEENSALRVKRVGDRLEIRLAPRRDMEEWIREYDRDQMYRFLQMESLSEDAYNRMSRRINVWPQPSPIPRIFLDTSVLINALKETPNYSHLVVDLARQGKVQALINEVVVREAEQTVRQSNDKRMLAKLVAILAEMDFEKVPFPRVKMIEMVDQVIEDEHPHALSSAWAGGASYILSLDRDAFLSPGKREAALPSIACTPREFIHDLVPL